MSAVRSSVNLISDSIVEFTSGIPEVERLQFNKIYALLKDLSLDSDGNIKATLENLKIIGRVKTQLQSIVDSSLYQDKIIDLNNALDNVNKIQTNYFRITFKDFTEPKTIEKLQELAFDSTVDQLAGAGIQENVVNMSADIVEDHIRDGSSFANLVDELKVKMLGNKEVDSKLISYAKQTINDTLSGFSRNYHALVTEDLGLEWFEYVGALVDSSRPVCIALVAKRWIHKSELAGVAKGLIDGVQHSIAGLYPGTNGSNFLQRCGGYFCDHQAVPVPSSVIPIEVRRQFEPKKKVGKEKAVHLKEEKV